MLANVDPPASVLSNKFLYNVGRGRSFPKQKTIAKKTSAKKRTNPLTSRVWLETLRRSFDQKSNRKAAVREGESWEGAVEENIAKWRELVGS